MTTIHDPPCNSPNPGINIDVLKVILVYTDAPLLPLLKSEDLSYPYAMFST